MSSSRTNKREYGGYQATIRINLIPCYILFVVHRKPANNQTLLFFFFFRVTGV